MESILISIIVPVYNVETYLSKCIESILQQTYKNLQIILVDDGSTDSSGKICDVFSKKDNRVRVLHKVNGGLVSARKAGLDIAEGTYTGFVDSDDYVNVNMYEELLKNIIDTGADFVHSGFYRGALKVGVLSNELIDIRENKAAFINSYLLSTNSEVYMTPSIWSKLFQTDFIKECYSKVPDTISMGEDFISLIACALYGRKVSIMNSAYYYYNIRNTSITHEKRDTALMDIVRLFLAIEILLKENNYYGEVKDKLEKVWMRAAIIDALSQTVPDDFGIEYYGISDMERLFGKKIVLFGAGKVGRDYYAQICRYSKCNIVAWVDTNYQNIHYECTEVVGRNVLKEIDYDILLIALKDGRNVSDIRESLIIEDGVKADKIMWIKPECFYA